MKRTLLLPCLAGLLIALTGCNSDGQFTLLGYTTRPAYDPSIRTVYIPIFGNETYLRGLEWQMTRQVVTAIESTTPMKVTDDLSKADTMLEGKILTRRKAPNNINQLGEVRDVELGLIVEVRWTDRRTGEVLSVANGLRRPDTPIVPTNGIMPGASSPDSAPITEANTDPTQAFNPKSRVGWVQIAPSASYVPELGGSTASGLDAVSKQTARQIAHMMEKWDANCAAR